MTEKNLMAQDNFYFIEVGKLCKRSPITCSPDISLIELAELMRQHNITGIVAVEAGLPVGIVSVRDLRDLVATRHADMPDMTVRDVMQTSLITIQNREFLFKAIFKMAKHDIHRLVVLRDDGSLNGIITSSDLLRVQARCPLYLAQEIEAAASFEQLRSTSERMVELLRFILTSGADIQSLISLISHFNDLINLRVATLLEQLEDVRLPRSAAFLVLGSEGRGEQTLRTDQDNAVVYRDSVSQEELAQIRLFAERMVDRLDFIGVPRCPGGIMASNRQWCHSISTWKKIVTVWIGAPTAENVVRFGMLQDLRVIHGNLSLGRQLTEHIIATTRQNSLFFAHLAYNITQFSPPLGLFGRIRLEQEGEQRGRLDLKKGGIFALTQGIGLLALMHGSMGGTTWEKLTYLRQSSRLSRDDLDQLESSFSHLVRLRLRTQLDDLAAGREPGNHCEPRRMARRELDQLRSALKGANLLLQILRDTFQLDLIAH